MSLRQGLTLVLICGLLSTFGFGCKGLSTTEKQAIAPVTLEYWTVTDDVDAINKLVAQYTAQRQHLKVNVRQLGPNEIYTRLVEELADDRGPDIISVNNRELNLYTSKLAPMPVSVQDTTYQVVKGNFSDQTLVNIATVNLPTLTQLDSEYVSAVKKDAVSGGRIYGLPLSLDTFALYYNKDLLDRAGIPEPPKNWEEFQDAVRKTTRFDANRENILQSGAALGTGNNIPGFDDLLFVLFRQSGVDFTASNGQAVFNRAARTESGATVAHNVVDFYTDYSNPARDTYSWNEKMDNALDKFARGSLAFFFGYSYHRPQITARAPQLNYGVLPLLQLNPDRPINAANYYLQTVVKKSKHQQEAWALINYLAHSTATRGYLEQSRRPTAMRAYIPMQQTDLELSPFVSQVLIAENWYRGRNYAGARKALLDLCTDWLAPTQAREEQIIKARTDALNRAAAKVNQTL